MAKNPRTRDKAAQQMLDKAACEGVETAWDRFDSQEPQCGFGKMGICCRICTMGPCRIDPFSKEHQRGVCGADADTIAARNLVRMIAAGTSAHSDHGRDVAHTMVIAARGAAEGYQVLDTVKLFALAKELGIKTEGRPVPDVALDVGEKCYAQFSQQEGNIVFTKRAPKKQQENWQKHGIVPRGVDREVVELMHRTNMGVDCDYKNIILGGMRTSLADGWGGSMVATELQDVLFGSPKPLRSAVSLGVLKKDEVNIVVHGHEPILSELIVRASRDKEMKELLNSAGAKGITVGGICCTANEILMRQGCPVVGNFLCQELAILTGAVDLMLVDVQCIMPGLAKLTGCFHTLMLTTSPKAKLPGVEHMEFHEEHGYSIAKEIVKKAVERFKMRKQDKVMIPDEKVDLIAGFTAENVNVFLGGKYRATYRPLNDAIMAGRVRGVAAVVGCNNPKVCQDDGHYQLVKELLKNDVLVLETGCAAIACAKEGMLQPDVIYKDYVGAGLRETCEAVGIPPVLHFGSCVDISRLLMAATNVVNEGGVGEDISELPLAAAAPEWMSEKAVAIGFYAIASGIYTVLGIPLPVLGSKNLTKFLTQDLEEYVGGKFAFESDPFKAAGLMIEHMNKKRELLKLKPMMYPPVGEGQVKSSTGKSGDKPEKEKVMV